MGEQASASEERRVQLASDTVFMLGSGAVANAWVPVIAALQEFRPTARVTQPDHANFVLSWWVYHQRSRAMRIQMADLTDEDRRANRNIEEEDLRLRQNIAAHIRCASDQTFYCLRRQAVGVINERRWGAQRFFLSTNWDRLPEMELGLSTTSTFHIHGDVEKPDCLYLPTETSTEPYRAAVANEHIAELTGTAWQMLQQARQVCIYGLSLSPLDVEVNVILGVGLEPRPGPPIPVYVYNLRGNPLDEAVWRVRAAAHPEARLEIHAMPLERETDPDVPAGWDRR
jgi:hypothetical protein